MQEQSQRRSGLGIYHHGIQGFVMSLDFRGLRGGNYLSWSLFQDSPKRAKLSEVEKAWPIH